MKKFIAILLIIVISLAACKGSGVPADNQVNTPTDNQINTPGDTENPNHSTEDTTENGSNTSQPDNTSNAENTAERLAVQWVNDQYKEYGISEITAKYIRGAGTSAILSGDSGADVYEWSISFKSEKDIEELEKTKHNTYTIEITQISVVKDGTRVLIDCFPKVIELEKYTLQMIYDTIKKDGRFTNDLLELPKNVYPKEMTEINTSEILGVRYCSYELPLSDNIIALVGSERTENTYVKSNYTHNYYKYVIVFYNSVTGEKHKVMEIDDCISINAYVKNQNLVLSINKNPNQYEAEEVITINSRGEIISREKYPIKNKYGEGETYSPDGKNCIFLRDNAMYCIDTQTGREQLLFKNYISKNEVEDKRYVPYYFIDNNRFVYVIGGYEWIYGTGIYNIKDNTDFFIDGDEGSPIGFRGEKIYLGLFDYSDFCGVKVVHLDKGNKVEEIIKPDKDSSKEFITHSISNDGTLFVKIHATYYNYTGDHAGEFTYEIEIYDLITYKKIKTYTMSTKAASLGSIKFINNDKALLSCYGHAFSDSYIYILNLT